MDRRLWQEIQGNENGRIKLFPPTIGPIQSATGHHQTGDGSFRWPMTIRDTGDTFPVLFNVVDSQPVPLLLGADLLVEMSAIINYRTKTLTLELPSQPELHMELLSSASAMLCVGKPITIPPSTSIVLRCPNPAVSEHDLFYDPAESYLRTLGLLSCASVSSGNADFLPINLINMSSNPISIPEGKRLGTLMCVDDVSPVQRRAPPTGKQLTEKLAKVLAELKFDSLLPNHPKEKAQLRQLIVECLDAFSADDNDIGNVQVTEFVIDTGDHPPLRARARQYSAAHRQAIAEEVAKCKQSGIVRPSSSPWASPVLIVKKKDNSNRMCVDFRALNSVTRKDSFPLPNIRDLIDRLSGSKWFSAFDVLWGFHNIPLAKDSIPKTAFIANDELLEYTRLPFGLANAPAAFQRMMCTALVGLGHISATYIDDVLVFATTLDDLLAPNAHGSRSTH